MKNLTFEETNEVLTKHGWVEFYDSVGDGWAGILDSALSQMEAFTQSNSLGYKIDCIKEKWAGLRIYADVFGDATDEMREEFYQILLDAECRSLEVCEYTGEPGEEYRSGFWRKTVNPAKAAELGFEKPKKIEAFSFRGNFN